MAYSNGQQQWVIDVPEPKWEHADEYQKQYKTLLANLRKAVQSAAKDDFSRCNWLLNQITAEMQQAILTAKKYHDNDAEA